ncbi:MAG: YrhK family protein [Trueperaceae bacterium]|nr:YrhK family protein [Trueperaceae bacterium]
MLRTRTALIPGSAAARPDAPEESAMRRRVRALRRTARRQLATWGNLSFLIGSVLFLWGPAERIGVWLFIVGSAAYLLDTLATSSER